MPGVVSKMVAGSLETLLYSYEVGSNPDWNEQCWRESTWCNADWFPTEFMSFCGPYGVNSVSCGCQVLCSMSWTGYWKLCAVFKVLAYPDRNAQVGGKPCKCCARGELFSSVYDVYDLKEKG